MKKRFDFKTSTILSTALLSSAILLTGCSGDSDDGATAPAAVEQNAMAVKQPAPAEAPKATLQPEAVEEVVKQVEEKAAVVEEAVVEKVEAVKEEITKMVAPAPVAVVPAPAPVAPAVAINGQESYATCAGCHGGNGEGGVGPALNNQSVADIVAKLEKYKAGEQMGPMTGMMAPMASGLDTATMTAIAEYITAK